MKGTVSRRNFLKLAGGAAAVGAAGAALPVAAKHLANQFEPFVVPPEEELPGNADWYASTCRMCPAGCGIVVRTVNGRAKKIEGNPEFPLNSGKLCARGQAGLQALYNPDRFKNAVRQKVRTTRKYEPLYWDEALTTVLNKIKAVDPGKIAFYGGLMSDHLYYLVSQWLEAISAPPPLMYDMQTSLEGRTTSVKVAEELFGSSLLPVYDIANSDVVFSFGANFSETWQSATAYNRAYGDFRGQVGGRGFFVQFEPRLSSTAATADEWVPIRPGMDGLVALALGRIIVEKRLGHGGTFGQTFAGMYRGIDVDTIARASGLPVEDLERLAYILADADRPVVIPGGHPAGHTNAYDSYLAIQSLNFILSRLGRQGGVYLTPPAPTEALVTAPAPNAYDDVQELINRMFTDDVELLFVYGANPAFELPDKAAFTAALARVPLVVSFNSFPDETAVYADLVLPDNIYLESWGYQVSAPGADRPAVAGQQPIVQPLYDTRSTGDVILELAHGMGGQAAEALPWANEILFLQDITGSLYGSSLTPYPANSPGEFWAAYRQYGGWWSDRELQLEPEPVGFANKPLPASGPTFEGSASEFPFHLHPYTSVGLSDGRGANLPWLQEMPDPMTTASWSTWVEINEEMAHHYGLHDNDVVRIESPHGAIEAVVVIYPGIRPDVVAVPIGQGHTDYGRYAEDRGSNPLNLLGLSTDPETGTLAWAATRVRIVPTGKTYDLARLENLHGEGREKLT